jgi:hypothetical protein
MHQLGMHITGDHHCYPKLVQLMVTQAMPNLTVDPYLLT